MSLIRLILPLAICFSTSTLFAQAIPGAMAYQGRLTDANNVPLPDGTGYEVEVRLWSTGSGGTLVWGARYTGVPVRNGAFNLVLGAVGGAAISGAETTDLAQAFGDASRHIGLTVTRNGQGAAIAAPAEIAPRQQILSSPYTFSALKVADGSVGTTTIQNDAVTSPKIADGTITGPDIAANAIGAGHIADAVLPISKIALEYAVFEERLPDGSIPPVPVQGWNVRSLGATPVALTGSSITLSGTRFNLKTGTYYVEAACPASGCAGNQAALFNVTATATPSLLGTVAYCYLDASGSTFSESTIKGYVTVTGADDWFEVRHNVEKAGFLGTRARSGFYSIPTGIPLVLTRVHVMKIK